MRDANILFDHVHLISEDPQAAASWYVDKLGGEIIRSYDLRGAPQIHLAFHGATIIVRGQRTGEQAGTKDGREWGVDHFGFQVQDDFDGFRNGLKKRVSPLRSSPWTLIPPLVSHSLRLPTA